MTRMRRTPTRLTSRPLPGVPAGTVENWSAVSRDGVWKYERVEAGGTPWASPTCRPGSKPMVRHTPRGA